MPGSLLRISAEFSPAAAWLTLCLTAVIAVFVLYVGIALWAVLCATDPEQRQVRYQVFRDLLGLFHRGKRQ
jgi:hypothetical protein